MKIDYNKLVKLASKIPPTILVILGATGELSRQRLIPALFHLHEHGLLPRKFSVAGFARSVFSHQEFRNRVKITSASSKAWTGFAKKIFYIPGDFTTPEEVKTLAKFIHGLESRNHSCANRLFYFATLPSHYETISHELSKSGLITGCHIHKRQTRVVIEKPFGYDLKSAQKLDQTLNKYFAEGQIYRIDHYLGKETVQNLLTIRFANSIFEPIWNRNYIERVEIFSYEDAGISSRGAYYEQTGAIRDVMQNHLMQLLALTAMEAPFDLSTESIRDERAKVIKAIKKPAAEELKNFLKTGQYQGYTKEPRVHPESKIETFARVKLYLENRRWQGVPFYLSSGKMLSQKLAQISVHFQKPLPKLFRNQNLSPNVLIFEIQPKEGLFLKLNAKYPGFGIKLHEVSMELGYHAAFKGEFPEAYERLLLDFLEGDQRLFARADEIESAWRYIDVLEKYLEKNRHRMVKYKAGSMGPA